MARSPSISAEDYDRLLSFLAGQGYDMAHVSRDLLALLRDLVVAKVCSEPGDLLDLPGEMLQSENEQHHGGEGGATGGQDPDSHEHAD